MKLQRGLMFVAVVCALVACRGKIVSTASLSGAGTADVSFTSDGKAVVLWADTDGEWKNTENFPAHYEIDVMAGTNKVGHISCDTQDSHESVCGTKITTGSDHRADCELKLACEVPAIPAGPASLHVVGTAGSTAAHIKKMSINIRSK